MRLGSGWRGSGKGARPPKWFISKCQGNTYLCSSQTGVLKKFRPVQMPGIDMYYTFRAGGEAWYEPGAHKQCKATWQNGRCNRILFRKERRCSKIYPPIYLEICSDREPDRRNHNSLVCYGTPMTRLMSRSCMVLVEEYQRCKSMREGVMGMERQCGVVGDP